MTSPKAKRNYGLWCVGILGALVLGLLLLAVILKGSTEILAHFFFLTSEDTEYSSSYTEEEFKSLTIGQSATSVIAALGKPIDEYAAVPQTSWLYAKEPHPEYSESGAYPTGSFTELTFDDKGVFQGSFGQLASPTSGVGLASSTSFTIGNGANTLSITKEEVERLRSEKATRADLRALYGEPREVYESLSVRWLSFSHSPGGTNYYLRKVGIDRSGRVCEIRSERYWD